MLTRSPLALVALSSLWLAAAAFAADAPQKYTLRYKLAMGDVVRHAIDHRASVRSTIQGTSQEAVTRSESVKSWKVIDVLPNGEIEFVHLVERVRMTNQLPDRAEMKYDSETDKTPPPGFEDAAAAVGVPLSVIRITPWGEVTNREVKHQQPAADNEAPVAVLLPQNPVAIGDTWTEPREVTVRTSDGAARTVDARRKFELKSVAGNLATIAVSYQVLSPINAEIEAQLAQRMMEGEVKFDLTQGRVVEQTMEVDKRVLGFAGPTSSMHYVMRMIEKPADERADVASRPKK